MYVYLDILVLVNLFVNTLVLWLTAWFLGISYQWYRLMTAVLLSVVYVVVFFSQPESVGSHPLFKLIVSAAIVFIAFWQKDWRIFFSALGAFYLISFLLGGAVLGYYFFCKRTIAMEGFVIALNLPLLAGGLFIGVLLFYLIGKYLFCRKADLCLIRKIHLANQYGETCIHGFWDSGNKLYDLTGSKPVLLIEKEALMPLFSDEVKRFLLQTPSADWFQHWPNCHDEEWKKSVVLIAYRSVGHESFLIGQRFAHVQLEKAGQWRGIDCIVGIYPGKLSGDGAYQALLHGSMC